ncbi:hypothetical protein X975_21475, partial [Stegodyphus mimosarum]
MQHLNLHQHTVLIPVLGQIILLSIKLNRLPISSKINHLVAHLQTKELKLQLNI